MLVELGGGGGSKRRNEKRARGRKRDWRIRRNNKSRGRNGDEDEVQDEVMGMENSSL